MSEFSSTRIADEATAEATNASLAPAITWLRTNTPLSRAADLEVFETLQAMKASGLWAVTFNGVSVP